MGNSEKVKIKLSELTDMYDIEDDSGKTKEKISKNDLEKPRTFDETIEEEDAKVEEEFFT